jgi:pimeloyl-ACP methyl ester carboxylesterase
MDSLAELLKQRAWFFPPPALDSPYWAFSRVFATYHPLAWWARVRVPVLLIYGAEDQRVPAAASADRIAAVLREARNTQLTTRILPGADHTFRLRPGPSGWPVTAPDYIPSLLGWLAQRR